MNVNGIIKNELREFNLDLIIEGLNEIISTGSFTTALSEDGDVVTNIVNAELNSDNCTLEENDSLSEIQNIIKDELQAWHGSPYDFDKFDVNKIGSGEGAEAFGWGLYFTDLKDIAQGYASYLSNIKNGSNKALIQSYINSVNHYVNNPDLYSNKHFRVYKDDKYGYFVNTTNNYHFHGYTALFDNVSYEEALPYMKERIIILQQELNNFSEGNNLYSVTLHKGKSPEQYDWLLWDKIPTITQIDKIKQKDNHVAEVLEKWSKDPSLAPATYQGKGFIGKEIYKYLASYFDSSKDASLFLLSAGIDGIKYPAESLAMGTTSDNARGFNYVVFDPNAVTIEKKISNNNLNESDQILSEGLSDVLYHFTYIPHLLNILKYNKFATSTNLGSTADANKDRGKFFFFSTQRTKGMSGYANHHGNNVAIVLDGRKLNYTFKGFATDYWNWSKKRSDYSDESGYRSALQSEENEDRIVTNKPYIDNAAKYIIEVHVLIIPEHNNQERVNEIQGLCKNLNIPIFFYLDENSFKLQNKRKAVALDQLNLEVAPEPSAYDVSKEERDIYDAKWFFKEIAPSIIAGNDDNEQNNNDRVQIESLLKNMLEKGGQPDQFENVMTDINDKAERLSTSWGRMNADDAYRSLTASIHNKRGDPNPYLRELLKMLINDMRKWGVKNLKEYFNKKFQAGIRENSNENINNENIVNNNENMSKSLKNTHDKTVKNRVDIDPPVLNEVKGEFSHVFHGTSIDGAKNIENYGVKISKSSGGYFGWGFYTATEFELAKANYADFAEDKGSTDKGAVLEFKISPEANILDLRNEQDFKTWLPYSKAINQPNLYLLLIKHGIDGLFDNSFEGVVIYNVEVLTLVKVHRL